MNGTTEKLSLLAPTLLIAIIAAASLAQAGVTNDVYGSWEMMSMEHSGVRYDIVMTIESDRVRVTSNCSHEGNKVEVVVSSAAKITDDELQITESDRAEKEYSPGYLQCSAAIMPMHVSYAIEEGKLVLTDPERAKPMVLTRISGLPGS